MSDTDRSKLPPERLTTKRIAEFMRVQSGTMLVLAGLGIYELHVRHYFLVSYAFVGATVLAFKFFGSWKRYRMVKSGTRVYATPTQSDLQKAFFGLCTAFVTYITIAYFNTQIGWTFCGVALLAVWLFTDHGLHRVFPEKPPLKSVPVQEQSEGAWPPAPRNADVDNNED